MLPDGKLKLFAGELHQSVVAGYGFKKKKKKHISLQGFHCLVDTV